MRINLNPFKKKEKKIESIIVKTKEELQQERTELNNTLDTMRKEHKEYLITREKEKREEEIKGMHEYKDDVYRGEDIPENLNTKEPWYIKTVNTFGMIIAIGFISWLFILLPKMQANLPDHKTLVTYFVMSCAVFIVLATITFLTGVGQELWRRFFNRWKYGKGKYVNALFITKQGVMKEIFVKKEDSGAFKVFNMPYVTNAKLSSFFKGLTTYIYREGNPDPINVWEERITEHLSCGEMDVVMNSAQAFDVKAWLENLKTWVLILLTIAVAAAAGAAYFSQNSNDMLKKGTYQPSNSPATCGLIIDGQERVGQNVTNIYNPVTNVTGKLNSINVGVPTNVG